MVTARVGKEQCPFLVDAGVDVSLLSYDVVEANRLVMQRQVARQPIMVDSTVLRCKGMVNEFIQLVSRGIRASFYVVRGISYGILGTDVLSSLAVQIDVAN